MASLLAGLELAGVAVPLWQFAAAMVLLAGCAVPLYAAAGWLPARWRAGLGPGVIFSACLLAAPVVLMMGLSAAALASRPVEWTRFEFRWGDPPAMDSRWRHMLPRRPDGASKELP